jgi:hypothetical protein
MLNSKRFWILCSLVLIAAIGFGWQQQAVAQSEEARYFPATGHWVSGEFLLKYEEIPNPTTIYGAPITEVFQDSISGLDVQYFEKVRFEFHPELPPGLRVKLSPLGEYLYQEGQSLVVPSNFPACRTFVESEYPICYAFLDFFEANGDVAQFGYPISGFEIHDGWIVQYFQNARFEWHPENPSGKWVTVSNLGIRYFNDRREDPSLLTPVVDNVPVMPVLRLRPRAFVGSSITPLKDDQTIYVIVQDQNLRPVPNVQVEFTVVLPDGSIKDYQASNTNQDGISTLNFLFQSNSPGIVNIFVRVSHESMDAQTRTSFRLWY